MVATIDELKRIVDNPGPKKANFQYGGVAGIDSHHNPITLSSDVRQKLLEVIEAVQGKLYPGNQEQSNRALLKGVWSCIKYDGVWEYGFIERPYGERWEGGNRRYAEAAERLKLVLKNGGLLAILEAQLTYWETIHTRHSISYLEHELENFLLKWSWLARQLNVTDPNSQVTAQRVEELRRRSSNAEQYPYLSPHGWSQG